MAKIYSPTNKTYSDGYNDWLKKFEKKRTTDECFTPPIIYDTILDWVKEQCPEIAGKRIIRPFYPNGDYTKEDYTNAVVIDNPPFSILSEIKAFYLERGIPFFLFAPHLTLFSSSSNLANVTHLVTCARVLYDNGARVVTSFVSNLFGTTRIYIAGSLNTRINLAVEELERSTKTPLPRYVYPDTLVSSALLAKYAERGVELRIDEKECHRVRRLDCQKAHKVTIFGNGYLVPKRVVDELKKQADGKTTRVKNLEQEEYKWTLSEREQKIVDNL